MTGCDVGVAGNRGRRREVPSPLSSLGDAIWNDMNNYF